MQKLEQQLAKRVRDVFAENEEHAARRHALDDTSYNRSSSGDTYNRLVCHVRPREASIRINLTCPVPPDFHQGTVREARDH